MVKVLGEALVRGEFLLRCLIIGLVYFSSSLIGEACLLRQEKALLPNRFFGLVIDWIKGVVCWRVWAVGTGRLFPVSSARSG
jgi:hypothetical protein